MDISNKRILICPLNWGFGHATRMVAYAKQLLEKNNTIIVAGDDAVLEIFKAELPSVERHFLSDINIKYSKNKKTVRKLILRSPRFLISLIRQHSELKQLLTKLDVDLIISDNRPTLWHSDITSYYVTHQPSVILTDGWHWAEGIATYIHQWFIKRFDACLIPDVEGEESLSGKMSTVNNKKINVHFIGWLSRFEPTYHATVKDDYTLLVLSGVEPSRTQFRDSIIKRYINTDEQLIIAGDSIARVKGNITILPYVRTEALKPLIESAKHVICRSGYSMVCDLKVLDCKAELVATPGQPEQEYLAKIHSR